MTDYFCFNCQAKRENCAPLDIFGKILYFCPEHYFKEAEQLAKLKEERDFLLRNIPKVFPTFESQKISFIWMSCSILILIFFLFS